jgi:hypothetical protein
MNLPLQEFAKAAVERACVASPQIISNPPALAEVIVADTVQECLQILEHMIRELDTSARYIAAQAVDVAQLNIEQRFRVYVKTQTT